MWPYAIHPTAEAAKDIRQHPVWRASVLRFQFIALLFAVGAAIYLFKKHGKILYGVSETLVSLLSNLVLIEKVDLLHPENTHLATADVIGIVGFTDCGVFRESKTSCDRIYRPQE
jgi:hypothetical protein